jgi:hypothetical protein
MSWKILKHPCYNKQVTIEKILITQPEIPTIKWITNPFTLTTKQEKNFLFFIIGLVDHPGKGISQ